MRAFSWEAIKTILSAVILVVIFKSFFFQPFNIPSGSMLPTLYVGDYLFVSKYAYGYGPYSPSIPMPFIKNRIWATPPKRGDIAVFRAPKTPQISFIKRVVGLPGETVQVREGVLYINGQAIQRTRVDNWSPDHPKDNGRSITHYKESLPDGPTYSVLEADGIHGRLDNTPLYRIPEAHYFMMGDNRDRSADSRDVTVSFIPFKNFIGRAELIFFSSRDNIPIWQLWRWPFSLRLNRYLERL